ncbi:MAG: hypothetical protein CMO80_18250 [Verrucomicrobiales bacterium]|nr:hypothetical protein [Verrucomicrobiales bacterium]|tara:strand:- start:136 stop:564 length:429 start_codon:yes stop_codon:yes gene_type:complete
MSNLLSTNFAPVEIVFLPEPFEADFNPALKTNAVVSVEVTSFERHQIRCEANASAESVLVIAQSYYPNWHAFVDGVEVPLMRANHSFQAIPISPGEHEVELRYVDYSFKSGLGLNVAGLLACLLIWVRSGRLRADGEGTPAA